LNSHLVVGHGELNEFFLFFSEIFVDSGKSVIQGLLSFVALISNLLSFLFKFIKNFPELLSKFICKINITKVLFNFFFGVVSFEDVLGNSQSSLESFSCFD